MFPGNLEVSYEKAGKTCNGSLLFSLTAALRGMISLYPNLKLSEVYVVLHTRVLALTLCLRAMEPEFSHLALFFNLFYA